MSNKYAQYIWTELFLREVGVKSKPDQSSYLALNYEWDGMGSTWEEIESDLSIICSIHFHGEILKVCTLS